MWMMSSPAWLDAFEKTGVNTQTEMCICYVKRMHLGDVFIKVLPGSDISEMISCLLWLSPCSNNYLKYIRLRFFQQATRVKKNPVEMLKCKTK